MINTIYSLNEYKMSSDKLINPICLYYDDHSFFIDSVRIADLITALSYFTIPIQLIYWGYKKNIRSNFISWLFIAFIFFCGCTHLFQVFNNIFVRIWVLGVLKWITALVSFVCAIGMIKEVPRITGLEQQIDNLKDKIIDFTNYIFHEIRVPLNSVIIGNHNLINSGNIGEDELKNAQIIERSLYRITHILNDILDVQKIEKEKLTINKDWHHFYHLIHEIMDEHEAFANNKHLHVIRYIASDLVNIEVYIDINRIHQCINNLLSNAIKYTKDGYVKLSAILVNEEIRISIEDTGCGISMENQKKIFKPYTQIYNKDSSEEIGTGLGLVITKKLIEMHGGNISFMSEEGVGSTFKITLRVEMRPVSDSNRENHETVITQQPDNNVSPGVGISKQNHSYKPKNIMIVDDNDDNLFVLSRLLEKLGIKVVTFNNGSKALDYYKTNHNEIELIFMDRLMPIMDGLETTRKIKNLGHPVFIFGLTGLANETDREEFLQAGADEVLSKPLEISLLSKHFNYYFNPENDIKPIMPDFTAIDIKEKPRIK